ncbi:MAG TPA: hypothetical protein VMC80_01355 [Patescibacteria group bacterium]|nr:hypothetical protein [Patescibacteria group bacterium]
MPKINKGVYRIEAKRYHKTLPKGVEYLNVGDQDVFGIWGYEVKKTGISPEFRYSLGINSQALRDVIVDQIRAGVLNSRKKDELVNVVLELALESMPLP